MDSLVTISEADTDEIGITNNGAGSSFPSVELDLEGSSSSGVKGTSSDVTKVIGEGVSDLYFRVIKSQISHEDTVQLAWGCCSDLNVEF